jgi:hypothetical protein
MSTPAATRTATRRGLWRWFVALLATVALVVSGSGLVVFAQSGSGESKGPQFVPADASIYVEARLDLPAGQGEALAQFMTAFPGFADPGSFELKLDELLAGLSAEIGLPAEADLIGDVFTGEVGLSLSGLESAMMGEDPIILAGLAVADTEAAGAVRDAIVAEGPEDLTEEMYNDVAIITDPSSSPPMSLAMHGGWMLVGSSLDVVTGAIDVLDGDAPGLADDPQFTSAFSRLPSARLGAAYMDFEPFVGFLDLAGMMAEGETGMALPVEDIAAMMPKEMVMSLVAEGDRMTLEALVTPGDQTPAVPVGDSELATLFPADTQIYLETRELGLAVKTGLDQLAEMIAAQEPAADDPSMGGMSEIEILFGEDSPITAMLGVPLPDFLDFVGDASVGLGLSSDGLWLGIAAEVNDEAAAAERIDNLMTVLAMFTMQDESGSVSIEPGDIGGVEVTSIVLPMDEMMAEAGVPFGLGDSIDIALDGDTLLIGLGDFVESAIVGGGADSLAASAGYVDALASDTVNSGVVYVNIGSLLAVLDPMLSSAMPEWSEIAPYVTGLDRLVVVGTAEDDLLASRITVITGQ